MPTVSYQAISLSDRSHTASLTAADILGNTGTKTWAFNVDTIAPAQVTDLAATTVSTTTINLLWTPVSDAAMYNVYRGGLKVGSPTANSFSDIGLTPSTTYSYSVHLEDNAGNEGTASNIIAPTTSADVLIHVVNIKMVIKTSVFNTYATVTVKIVDANNNPVSGGNSHRQMVKRDPR